MDNRHPFVKTAEAAVAEILKRIPDYKGKLTSGVQYSMGFVLTENGGIVYRNDSLDRTQLGIVAEMTNYELGERSARKSSSDKNTSGQR